MNRELASPRTGDTTIAMPLHAPRVPENDAAIVVERPQLRRPDGILDAYAAYPKSVRPQTPGIVVVMHAFGVDAHLRDVVRRFAKFGFTAIAPDLYTRMRAPSGDGTNDLAAFEPYSTRLARKECGGDLRAAALNLLAKAPQCKLGIVGFGIGGALAIQQAVDNGDVFDAVASFYGAVSGVNPLDVHVPASGSYAEKDERVSADEVRVWRSALRVGNEFRIYPSAQHGFFDETRTSYAPSVADDSWKRTSLFFKETLGLS